MWRAELRGSDHDIDDLERVLPAGGRFSVDVEGDKRYLAGAELNTPDASDALKVARRVLGLLNAAALLADRGHRVVETNRLIDENGRACVFVEPETATAYMRASVATVVTSSSEQPPTPTRRLRTWGELILDLEQIPAVGEVCDLLLGSMSAVDQYKIWEIVGDPKGPLGKGHPLAPKKEATRFTRSVNDPAVSGLDARHARLSGLPSSSPMSIGEARAFIEQVVRTWLERLAEKNGIPTETDA